MFQSPCCRGAPALNHYRAGQLLLVQYSYRVTDPKVPVSRWIATFNRLYLLEYASDFAQWIERVRFARSIHVGLSKIGRIFRKIEAIESGNTSENCDF